MFETNLLGQDPYTYTSTKRTQRIGPKCDVSFAFADLKEISTKIVDLVASSLEAITENLLIPIKQFNAVSTILAQLSSCIPKPVNPMKFN